MMNKTALFSILLSFATLCMLQHPVLSESPITSPPTNTVFTGRATGMGGAFIALSDDGEGIFFNPSGLAGIKFPQLVGTSRRMILDEVASTTWGWALPTDYGVFGLGYSGSIISGSYQTMRDPGNDRIILNPSLEAINHESSASFLVYSTSLPWYNLSVGGCLKYFFSRLYTSENKLDEGSGFNADVSASFRPYPFLKLAMNIQNLLNSQMAWSKSSESVGGFTKFGAAVNLLGSNTDEALLRYDQKVTAAFDIDFPRDMSSPRNLYHFGLEWEFYKNFFLRGGINQRNSGITPTFGVGLINSGIRFDYAFMQYPGMISDNPHYFSISYVGDRIFEAKKDLKNIESDIRFLDPPDRSITSNEVAFVKVEPIGKKVYELKKTWRVPLIETTFEAEEITEKTDLARVQQDGYPVNQTGTIEFLSLLDLGRNVIAISGYVTPENTYVTDELRILRVIPFSDLRSDQPAAMTIELFAALDLVSGYPNHTFLPEKPITRAELAALLVRTGDVSPEKWEQAQRDDNFPDTKGKWSNPYANLGVEMGYFNYYPDNSFRPNQLLTRAEAVTTLVRFAKITARTQNNFPDIKPDHWAAKYIQAAKDAGWLEYLKGGNFDPDKIFTRSEAVNILYNTAVVQRQINEFWDYGIIKKPFSSLIDRSRFAIRGTK